MPEYIEAIHFKDLEACDPKKIIEQTGCEYDPELRQYHVNIWGCSYCVDLLDQRIFAKDSTNKTYQDYIHLFVIFYLIKARKMPIAGEWISEKDIPGGEGFFRGPHTLPVDLITDRVGNDLQKFESICTQLGGQSIDFADKAFCFQVTPLIPVAILYWQGDEDFPDEAKLLFDKTIKEQLPLDIVFALAVEVCFAFKVA